MRALLSPQDAVYLVEEGGGRAVVVLGEDLLGVGDTGEDVGDLDLTLVGNRR
jgi:hypothetical protein